MTSILSPLFFRLAEVIFFYFIDSAFQTANRCGYKKAEPFVQLRTTSADLVRILIEDNYVKNPIAILHIQPLFVNSGAFAKSCKNQKSQIRRALNNICMEKNKQTKDQR